MGQTLRLDSMLTSGSQVSISSTVFLYEIFGAKISKPKASFIVYGAKILYKKRAKKTLTKLTTVFEGIEERN
jgi:hypothetical protein